MENLKQATWEIYAQVPPENFFSTILCFLVLFNKIIDIFSEQPFFRFSYKHCNFSHVCPLVKMAYYTDIYSMELTSQFFGAYDDNMSLAQNMSPLLAVLDERQSVEWETKG